MSSTQKTKPYGIGIIGCGSISGTHAEAILHTEKGKLVAVQSRTKASLETFCEKYDVPAFTSYDEFLAQSDLDLVVICTPSGTHLDMGKKAAEAGKHVVVEKPVEISVARGRELIRCCRENDVKLAVIYQNRYIHDVIEMKRGIEGGKIGHLFMANASVKWFRDQAYYSNSGWRGTLALDGGGAVINQAIHTVDLLQWMAGGVESVQAFKGTFTHEGIEAEDNAVASLQFKNGTIGVFVASTSITPPQDRTVEIFGDRGTAFLKGDQLQWMFENGDDNNEKNEQREGTGAADPMAGMTFRSHKNQYDQILDAIQQNVTPPVSGEESLQSLAVVEALYRSAEEGRLVRVEEVLSG